MKKHSKRWLALALSMLMVITAVPTTVFASVTYNHNSSSTTDSYYNVVSKKDWDISPGISESEIVLNNASGTRRQVSHIMVADLNNEYVKVTTGYANMDTSVFDTATVMEMAAAAESKGYNVVGGMNTTLSWYNGYPAEHVHEPLGFMMLDGETLWDLTQSYGKLGFPTCVVINSDDRPEGMDKVEMKQITGTQDLTGYEEQVIPCSSGYIVKNGVNQSSADHSAGNSAPRSVVGVTADGQVVIMMNDGRGANNSEGMSMYECAEMMINLGCTFACNCDGGGSSTFVSERPGEDIAVHCVPSDGAERSSTSGILFITTAPSDGQFAVAHVSADAAYYTPYSEVTFDVIGTDLVGNPADIPAEATWQIKEDGMGTIDNGVFVSNGTTGTVTAQVVYEDKVVGEASIDIVNPTDISFTTAKFSVKYGTSAQLSIVGTVNNGANEVVMKADDFTITNTNTAIGSIDGFTFTAVDENSAPTNKTGTVTATYKWASGLQCSASLAIMAQITEVIEDFDNATNHWNICEISGEGVYASYGKNYTLSDATAEDGQVFDGDGSMRLWISNINAKVNYNGGSKDYFQLCLFPDESIELKNCESYGMWVYIPDDMYSLYIDFWYYTDSNNDGTYETVNKKTKLIQAYQILEQAEDSHWYYVKTDVGGKNILLPGKDLASWKGSSAKNPNDMRCIHVVLMPHNADARLQQNGSVNGIYTMYFDNIIADYAKDVADRTAPVFSKSTLLSDSGENDVVLQRNTVANTNSNILNVSAEVSDAGDGINASSAKAYVDGVEVNCAYSGGKMAISNIAVANGVHRVTFKISDRAGNEATIVRLINVNSSADASTIVVEPKDATLDRILGGSVYWMDLEATDIETIQSVTTTIDLNSVNHWELDHMVLAPGFSADYTVDTETNSANITITRTGENTQTGEAVLASLPIRVIYFDTDIQYPGMTAAEYWQSSKWSVYFWAQDVKVDVDMGQITYVSDYQADTIGTFSNDKFSVDTEMYLPQPQMISDDLAYYQAHQTCHVHSAVALEDVAATCTATGYTGRTYCEVCDSVVDWGTTIPMAAHNYELVDGQFVCSECGDVYEAGTGLFEINGEFYYAINGNLLSGWQAVDEDMYYFNPNTFAAVKGAQTINTHNYVFNENGVLVKGSLENDGEGHIRYFFADTLAIGGWTEIDGNTYYFEGTGLAKVGISKVTGWDVTPAYYLFSQDGILQSDMNGLYFADNGDIHYLENGKLIAKGLVQDTDGSYYYISSTYKALKDTSYGIGANKSNGLVPEGTYTFGPDGKMIVPDTTLQGLIIDADGNVRYYVDGEPIYAGLVEDGEGNYYYINSSKTAVKNCSYGVTRTNNLLPEGLYEFDEYGRIVLPDTTLQGLIIDADGNVRYYVDGEPIYAGLVQDGDGNYYYINSSKTAVKNCTYGVTRTNDLLPEGLYTFGADGKMIIEVPEAVEDGLVIDDFGDIRFYIGGVAVYAGLVQDGDGNYYYINSSKTAVKNCTYGVTKTNGLLPSGLYSFGADGKMLAE